MNDFASVADVIEMLPQIVRDMRRTLGLSLRDTAEETGISINSLSRFDRGHPITQRHTVTLLRWLSKRQPDALQVIWGRRERLAGWAEANPGAEIVAVGSPEKEKR